MTSSSRILAILDTNVIFSGLGLEQGTPFSILEYWRSGAFDLVISTTLIVEYREVLARPSFVSRFDPTQAATTTFFRDLLSRAVVSEPLPEIPVRCRDPKDDKLLATALGVPNSLLVTGDLDLLTLSSDERLGGLRIIRSVEFLNLLDGAK